MFLDSLVVTKNNGNANEDENAMSPFCLSMYFFPASGASNGKFALENFL